MLLKLLKFIYAYLDTHLYMHLWNIYDLKLVVFSLTPSQIGIDERTDGIDLSASCSFNLTNRSSWKLAIRGEDTEKEETEDHRKNMGILGKLFLR